MATIHISGLPSTCKLPRVIFSFRNILKREGIARFWIKEMSDIRGTDWKSANIEFDNNDEAYRALTFLDGFMFDNCRLSASVEEERRRRSPSPYNYRSKGRSFRDDYAEPQHSRYGGYSRGRSRSPISHEASKLDMEIELLKKQRMIIEEERRLLLERKKLELVKEFGPSAMNEMRDFEGDFGRDRDRGRYRGDRGEPPRRRRRSPSPPPRKFAPRPPPGPPPKKPKSQLPQFLLPCKLIFAELKEHIDKLSTKKENFLLTKLLRSTIRKRIAVALEGLPIMPGAQIKAIYREKYPRILDEDFVKKHLKDLRACHLHLKDDKEEKNKENDKAGGEEKQETKDNEDAGNTKNGTADNNIDPENDSTSQLTKEKEVSMEETKEVTNETDEKAGENDSTLELLLEEQVSMEEAKKAGADEELLLEGQVSMEEAKKAGADNSTLELEEQVSMEEAKDNPDGTKEVQGEKIEDEIEAETTENGNAIEASGDGLNSHDDKEVDWMEGEHGWDDDKKEEI